MNLIQRLQQSDKVAFTEIYNQYWDKLYVLAHRHLKQAALAEEIVQEVFLTLWKKRESLIIHELQPYLAAMLRHAVYRQLASNPKNESLSLQQASNEQYNTEAFIENKWLLEKINTLSDRLPEKCRLVFIQNKVYDQPVHVVANNLNISIKTAEAHLTKALKLMRQNLGNASTGVVFLVLSWSL